MALEDALYPLAERYLSAPRPQIERTARGKHRLLVQRLDMSRYLDEAALPEGLHAAV